MAGELLLQVGGEVPDTSIDFQLERLGITLAIHCEADLIISGEKHKALPARGPNSVLQRTDMLEFCTLVSTVMPMTWRVMQIPIRRCIPGFAEIGSAQAATRVSEMQEEKEGSRAGHYWSKPTT